MVKQNAAGWTLPRRRPITKQVLDRGIAAEQEAAVREHQAQEAWFDRQHGAVMLKLRDGRVFGAEPNFIPSLQAASPNQLDGLRATENGIYLVVQDLDLHISVDGLVTRIMEHSALAIRVRRAICRVDNFPRQGCGVRAQWAVGRTAETDTENLDTAWVAEA